MTAITGYHAHVYFDAETEATAQAVCQEAGRLFPVTVGRMHRKPVGPHPSWSCQLEFGPDAFARVIPWLMLNRRGLTVFVHANTGDALADHRDHDMWMGAMPKLDLSIFA